MIWNAKDNDIPPLEKGEKGDLKKNVLCINHKISPIPSLPKRGIFG
jgi:hypothetical protein